MGLWSQPSPNISKNMAKVIMICALVGQHIQHMQTGEQVLVSAWSRGHEWGPRLVSINASQVMQISSTQDSQDKCTTNGTNGTVVEQSVIVSDSQYSHHLLSLNRNSFDTYCEHSFELGSKCITIRDCIIGESIGSQSQAYGTHLPSVSLRSSPSQLFIVLQCYAILYIVCHIVSQ